MSQINDALKRAKEAQSPTPPAGVPPISPVETQPSRRPRQIIIPAIVVFAASLWLFAGPLACNHQSTTPPAAPTNTVTETTAPPAITPKANAAPAPAAPLPKLQGIVYDAANPVAIVNGKSVHAGDRVGDYKIVAIGRDRVAFKKADGSVTIVTLGK